MHERRLKPSVDPKRAYSEVEVPSHLAFLRPHHHGYQDQLWIHSTRTDTTDSTVHGEAGLGSIARPLPVSRPRAHGRPIELQVTVGLTMLLGLTNSPGEIPSLGPIPATVV